MLKPDGNMVAVVMGCRDVVDPDDREILRILMPVCQAAAGANPDFFSGSYRPVPAPTGLECESHFERFYACCGVFDD